MNLWRKLPGFLQRRLALWLGRNLCPLQMESPLVSFTFDDFPRSAFQNGGAILLDRGARATFFTSFGLMDRMTPTGQIFSHSDLSKLVEQGHELACHTFDHCDSWETAPAQFEASILRNQHALGECFPGAHFRSLSYPITCPRPQTKRAVAKYYDCARGGGQSFNVGTADLNYLKAFFLEQSRDNLDGVKAVIDASAGANGWLIFATHDVDESPTRFGCTPAFFERVVDYAAKSGATVLPMHEAFQRVCQAAAPRFPGHRRLLASGNCS